MPLTGKIKSLFEDKEMTIPVFPRTKVKAVSDDNGVGLGALLDTKADKTELDAKADKYNALSVSLVASGWSGMTQTVNVSGVAEDNAIIPVPAPESHMAYCEAGVYCSAQSNGTLTFTCADVPAADLVVNVLILN